MLTLKDLLFPRRCPVCDRPVKPAGELICANCRPKLRYVHPPFCLKCGRQLSDAGQEYCADCAHKRHVYDRGISLYQYQSVRNTIYRFTRQPSWRGKSGTGWGSRCFPTG